MILSMFKTIYRFLFFIIFILLFIFSCNTVPQKYSDVKDVFNKMIKTYEVFIDEINRSEESDEVKRSIDKFINNMIKLDEVGIKLQSKYPELNDDSKVPKYLLDLQQKLIKTATSERTKATSIIILSYTHDPEVKEAADKLSVFLDGVR